MLKYICRIFNQSQEGFIIHKKRRSKKNQPKKRWKNWLINFLLVILLIIGLALIFNEQIKNQIVKQTTATNRIEHMTPKKIKKNEQKKADFNFEQVKSLDFDTIIQARLNQDQLAILGGIAVPSVQLNLPIIKGVSNYSLAVGAGTMKEEQVMGSGNYALASHHMINESLLFSPLVNVNTGALIYLTDLSNVYTYKITMKEYVTPDQVQVIDDVADKKLVTLVTCDTTGNKRLIVQGELVSASSTKDASKEAKEAFNIATNTYK